MLILKGIIFGIIAQAIAFFQLQGQLKYEWMKDNIWFGVLMGMPISYFFILSVRSFIGAFDGQIWPSRLIGFGIGVIVFTTMAQIMFKEPLSTKTLVCLSLGTLIVLIQIFWK